jgi:activator of 2-hydroxyglutaryl-CoA dehydratase
MYVAGIDMGAKFVKVVILDDGEMKGIGQRS